MNQNLKSSTHSIEINPHKGLGPILFGFSPRKVQAIWGENHVWETWMGGNRNHALLYPGIIIGFDQCNTFGPLENSCVVEFSIHKTFKHLHFLELDIFSIAIGELQSRLNKSGISFNFDKNCLMIPSFGLEFGIGSNDRIEEIDFWKTINS